MARRRKRACVERDELIRDLEVDLAMIIMSCILAAEKHGYDEQGHYRTYYDWEPLREDDRAKLAEIKAKLTREELTEMLAWPRSTKIPHPQVLEELGLPPRAYEKPTADVVDIRSKRGSTR